GHPEPMRCPEGVARRSLALYYFTEEARPSIRSTEYRARPGEGAKSVVIYLDKQSLRTYDWAKRRLGLTDSSLRRTLRVLERLRRRKR
ncbi:MAG: 2OG-Fe(II) oxygenase, partial [Acidimicrobiales bacterium]